MTVLVSTDDEDIADHVGRNWPWAEIHLRDVANYEHQEPCSWRDEGRCDCNRYWFDYLDQYQPTVTIFLQPTSPLRIGRDIEDGWRVWQNNDTEYVFSVSPASFSPKQCLKQDTDTIDGNSWKAYAWDNHGIRMPSEQHVNIPYVPNGSVYIISADLAPYWTRYMPKSTTYVYETPADRSIDVDTEEDLMLAEAMMEKRLSQEEPITSLQNLIRHWGFEPVARLLGVTQRTIRRWQSGTHDMGVSTGRFIMLCDLLRREGIDVDQRLRSIRWGSRVGLN